MTNDLNFTPVRRLGKHVRTRQVSPMELVETFLHRLSSLGPRYNAVVTLTDDLALQQARQAEKEIASGNY